MKTVFWSIDVPSTVAVISRYGTLSARAAGVGQTVVVTASAKDGSGVTETFSVQITPPVTSVAIFSGDENVTRGTVYVSRGTAVQLTAQSTPDDASQQFSWRSGSRYVVVDPSGLVSVAPDAPKIRVTVTAAALDGSGRTASVTIVITD